MVELCGVDSLEVAQAIVARLDIEHIPSLLDSDVQGAIFLSRPRRRGSSVRVLVPLRARGRARAVLRASSVDAQFTLDAVFDDDEGDSGDGPRGDGGDGGNDFANDGGDDDADDDEAEDGDGVGASVGLTPPERYPAGLRVTWALAAIVLLTALSESVVWVFGDNAAVAHLAARADHLDEPWRLVVASFLHAGPAHLLSNAVFGVLVGSVLFETHLLGAVSLVWLLSSAAGLGIEAAMGSGAVLGASAGNYGLVGLWAKGQLERSHQVTLPRWERLRTVGVILLLVPGALTPVTASGSRVAVLAHAVGFVAGFFGGYVFHRRLGVLEDPSIDRRSRWAFVIAAALTVSSIAAAGLRLAGRWAGGT